MQDELNLEQKISEDKKVFLYNIGLIVIIFILIIGVLYYFLISGRPVPFIATKNEFKNIDSEFIDAYNKNDFVLANKIANDGLSKNNEDFDSLLMKASTLAQQASLQFKEKELGDEAMIYIDKAIKINPTSVKALVIKGYIYEIQQDYVNTHKYYDEALSIDNKDPDALAQKGHAYALQGEVQLSKKYYSDALNSDENNIIALFGIGKIAITEKNLELAKSNFIKITKGNANNRQKSEAFYTLSLISKAESPKNLEEAKTLALKAIEADPTYPHAHISLADTLFKMNYNAGDKKKANDLINQSFREIDQAMKINDKLTVANLQLLIEYLAMNDKKSAKIVLSGMTQIVENDITLDKNEKSFYLDVVDNLKNTLK